MIQVSFLRPDGSYSFDHYVDTLYIRINGILYWPYEGQSKFIKSVRLWYPDIYKFREFTIKDLFEVQYTQIGFKAYFDYLIDEPLDYLLEWT